MLAIVLCFVIAFSSGYAIQNGYFNGGPSRSKPSANVFVTVQTEMGTYDILVHNVITDIGENQTATRMRANGTYVAVEFISLGNATAAAALTKLTTEATTLGAIRADGTVSDLWLYSGDAAYNVTNKFTFTGDITLNATGSHWLGTSDSDSNMYSCANFAQTAFASNWNLTINI